MIGCGREDRLADGMRATCGHRIHGPTAPAFICRDCLLADRDRLAARLEISDDPEMSVDKIEHLEGMLESERRYAKRLAAELARVRRSQLHRLDRLADQRCDELLDLDSRDAQEGQGQGFYWRWFGRMIAFRDACRAALAQPQDGTTEGRGRMECPDCSNPAQTKMFRSRIWPKSPPFWRWICDCGWWSSQWFDQDPAQPTTNDETRG